MPDANDVLAGRIVAAVTALARQLRYRHLHVELTLSPMSALATIAHDGPLTLRELARTEHVCPQTLAPIVVALTCSGLVAQSRPDCTGRPVRVAASARGESLVESDESAEWRWLADRLEALTVTELATLADATEIIDSLAAAERTE